VRLTPHLQDLVDLSLTRRRFFVRLPVPSAPPILKLPLTPSHATPSPPGSDPLYNCSLSAYASVPVAPPPTCYRCVPYSLIPLIVTLSLVLCLMRIPPFLIPIYPSSRSFVRIICRQACTVVCEHPTLLPSSPLFLIAFPFLIPIAFRSYRSKRPPRPRPLCPFHFPPRTVPLLSLFSVLGFVWVEGVSRGHCIVYKCVYLRLARLSRDFLFDPCIPPSPRSSRLCVYWFTLGGRIYVNRWME
jgi:hypothetical protein